MPSAARAPKVLQGAVISQRWHADCALSAPVAPVIHHFKQLLFPRQSEHTPGTGKKKLDRHGTDITGHPSTAAS